MRRLRAALSVILPAAALVAALAGCGGGESADLLPGKTASEITSNLEQVQRRVSEGDCVGAEDAVAAVRSEIAGLGGVDRQLKANLGEGADRLEEVVVECEETEPEETETMPETAVEPEGAEKEKKPKKEKPAKQPEEAGVEPVEEPEADTGPTLPPQANGKGEEKAGGAPPPPEPEVEEEVEEEEPSGGVGPGVGVE